MIDSRRHPLIARLRAAARREGDEVLLDGPHLVHEALRSGTALTDVAVATHTRQQPEIAHLVRLVAQAGVPVHEVSGPAASAISPTRTPSGIVALATLQTTPLATLLEAADPLLVALVGVQDPGNVGGVIRTAEAAGVTGVLALADTADPLGWKALRGAMGSTLRVPVCHATDALGTLQACRAGGLQVLIAAPHRTGDHPHVDVTRPTVVVFGSEGRGLPEPVRGTSDGALSIVLANEVESLNIGVAAGVLLFAIRRARLGRSLIDPPLDV